MLWGLGRGRAWDWCCEVSAGGLAHGLSSGDWLEVFVGESDVWAMLMDALWVGCTGSDVLCLSGNIG